MPPIGPHSGRHRHLQSGFTLIELVCTVVIIATLAAVAMPQFVSLTRDANLAALATARAAVFTASENANIVCRMATGCRVSYQSAFVTGPGGVQNKMYFGYPTGQARPGQFFGIKDWVDVQGFTVHELSTNTTEFRLAAAPTPTACKVVYVETSSLNNTPSITTTETGC